MARKHKRVSEYEVEEVVSHRTIKGRREYKIRWRGYSPSEDTWEVEDNLNCGSLIEEYLAALAATEVIPSKEPKKRKISPIVENGDGDSQESSKKRKAKTTVKAPKNATDKTHQNTNDKTPKNVIDRTEKKKREAPTESRRSLRSPAVKKEAPPVTSTSKPRKRSPSKKTSKKTKEEEYEVEKITKMKTGRNGKRTFFVHWVGYDESDATWEPEEHLKGTDVLSKFLKSQG